VGLVLYQRPQLRRLGIAWLSMLSCSYAVLACPAVAGELADLASSYRPVRPVESVPRTESVIVLGGDNSAGRVREAARVYLAWAAPSIIVLGEDWFVDHLREAGIPLSRIRQEAGPATTRAQMEWVRDYIAAHEAASAAIIASRLQMPRIAALAETLHLRVTLLPSEVDVEPRRSGERRWIPSLAALALARDALYEDAAIAYYRARGWIRRRSSTSTTAQTTWRAGFRRAGGHGPGTPRLSCLISHVRAMRQSRATVSADTSRTCAVSSTVRPEK